MEMRALAEVHENERKQHRNQLNNATVTNKHLVKELETVLTVQVLTMNELQSKAKQLEKVGIILMQY